MFDYETPVAKSYIRDEAGKAVEVETPASMYFYGYGTGQIGERKQPKANCRNCGAPPKNAICAYCDTPAESADIRGASQRIFI